MALFAVVPVSAGWEQTDTHVDSTYEVKSGSVHVTKYISFTNQDEDTRFWQGYYSSLSYYIPDKASNLIAYDISSPVQFSENNNGYFLFEFDERVWYGESYAFTIEYDIPATPSSATFYVQETVESADVTLIVEEGYETQVSGNDYVVSSDSGKTIYKFESGNIWKSPSLVSCAKKTDTKVATCVVPLELNNVTISVEYWEGEDEWAQHKLDVVKENLPLQEELWGIPYPGNTNIIITECSFSEMNGYKGFNNGNGKISILNSASDQVLIHEIVHCWTRGCHFDELWMHEGYANFYTYLALEKTDSTASSSMKDNFFEGYDEAESLYALDLDEWSVPATYNSSNAGQVDFGYDKSFVMVYGLYEEIGLSNMKAANKEFSSSRGVDSNYHKSIAQSVSDKDLESLYGQFV
ncbi:hypothetical protein J2755_002257 [Methanohalophilus levihalophilus]|uniref:hypothetical protein n=1 Tax=Methanohalophilus levihalophilus TaxID=1431282 RepID=UPI001AE13EB2|nr:hypothetical protein [Methanohalophilus levihalophilus]MBP2031294.1 hypothetical protein [Methanohalophilus levihalophilus]